VAGSMTFHSRRSTSAEERDYEPIIGRRGFGGSSPGSRLFIRALTAANMGIAARVDMPQLGPLTL